MVAKQTVALEDQRVQQEKPSPSDHPFLGRSVERVEDAALLTGRGTFIDDLGVKPGTLFAAFVRSPLAHARIVKVDVGAALKVAVANNLYGYDAYMLPCATETKAILVTLDGRMAAVGRSMGLDVVEG